MSKKKEILTYAQQFASLGGKAVSKDRKHMSELGKKGSASRWKKAREAANEKPQPN